MHTYYSNTTDTAEPCYHGALPHARGCALGAADARRSLLAGGAPVGGGTVVVSLQQTKLDGDCQLRICPGCSGAFLKKLPSRFPQYIFSVRKFCTGAQAARQPFSAFSGPGSRHD